MTTSLAASDFSPRYHAFNGTIRHKFRISADLGIEPMRRRQYPLFLVLRYYSTQERPRRYKVNRSAPRRGFPGTTDTATGKIHRFDATVQEKVFIRVCADHSTIMLRHIGTNAYVVRRGRSTLISCRRRPSQNTWRILCPRFAIAGCNFAA